MTRGVNKVTLIGNLGADPEIRYTNSGSAVANIRLATAEAWRDKETGEQQERTEWHRVVFFSRLAEIVGEYLKKGSQVYIEGRIQTRKWQDRDGNDRYTTEIIANEMQMLGGRGGGGSSFEPATGSSEGSFEPATGSSEGSFEPAEKAAGSGQKSAPEPPIDDFDDDIPF